MTPRYPRRCVVVRGPADETLAAALRVVEHLSDREVLWVEEGPSDAEVVSVAHTRRHLGASRAAVVLPLHGGFDPELLGRCHGLVRAGGALVLRLPPAGVVPTRMRSRMAVWPHGVSDVGTRSWARLEASLSHPACTTSRRPLGPPHIPPRGTDEQAGVVAQLTSLLSSDVPQLVTLTADRGRGKSSAVGLAVRALAAERRVVVTAGHRKSVAEVLRFAEPSSVRFEDAGSLPRDGFEADIVVVDEAATMPVGWLRDMVKRHPRAHLVFCTTVHGYEGTGRGFTLRFRPWLDGLDRPVTHLTLTQPIRWEAGDPLEDWLFGLLALDARPRKWSAGVVAPLVVERVPPGVLADDESLLRQVFGLLVQAHYRTTPSDLLRMLDAPNVSVHVARRGDLVVGATLVAREGGLTPEACEAIWRGASRVRGHALADTLVSHAGARDAGQLHMVRSVRIATHPELRRAGIGRRLVEHVHQTYQADLYGTMFGVTEAVIGFRRTLGYEVVRLGAARSARTGEPSVVMLRAAHPEAQRWITQLRRQLAWDLPAQVMLWQAERVGAPSEALVAILSRGLGAPVPPSSQEMRRLLGRYVRGHLTFEGAVATLLHVLDGRWERVAAAAGRDAEAVAWRLRHRRGWLEVMARTGLPSVPATMRSVRRGLAAALEALGVEV